VLQGNCDFDERPLLEARLERAGGERLTQLALNDVVMQKYETGRMLDFESWIDGRFVNSHGADGMVVASATGSTAYALSCGGPIVEPHLDVVVVAPICPHTLSDRPIVVPRRSTVEVMLIDRPGTRAHVTVDGVVMADLVAGDRLAIAPSNHAIRLLHPKGYDYYRLLRSKLHWGRGGHAHQR
jgi:NAD+ kinase